MNPLAVATTAELIDELQRRGSSIVVGMMCSTPDGKPQHLYRRNGDKITLEGLAASLHRQCMRDVDQSVQPLPPSFGGPLTSLDLPRKPQ